MLIKVFAAPINPSDLYCMKGMYNDFDVFNITDGVAPGWEGSGVAIKSGGGMIANGKVGKRVSFVRMVENGNHMAKGGCYQQYALADAMVCGVLPDSIPSDIGAMSFVNPITAYGLYEEIGKHKAVAAIQTGAAS